MDKKPKPPTAEPPPSEAAKPTPARPMQFGPSVSAPGSRLKKR